MFIIFWDFRSLARIQIVIISLIMVSLNLIFIFTICIAIELRFYLLIHFKHLEFHIWICSLVHRIGFSIQFVHKQIKISARNWKYAKANMPDNKSSFKHRSKYTLMQAKWMKFVLVKNCAMLFLPNSEHHREILT